jgi:hypothetical protein
MNLYLLHRTNQYSDCDSTTKLVVRADSEPHARQIAATAAGDEGSSPWLSGFEADRNGMPCAVTCELLTADGDAGVVCRDYY